MKMQEENGKWIAVTDIAVHWQPDEWSVRFNVYKYALIMPKRDDEWIKRTVEQLRQEVKEIFEREHKGNKIDIITHHTNYLRLTDYRTSADEETKR